MYVCMYVCMTSNRQNILLVYVPLALQVLYRISPYTPPAPSSCICCIAQLQVGQVRKKKEAAGVLYAYGTWVVKRAGLNQGEDGHREGESTTC